MIEITRNEPPMWRMMIREYGMRQWRDYPDLVVAYDGKIHTQNPVPPDVVAHEVVHLRQQERFPGGPEAFMRRYMTDTHFKIAVEIEAYQAQLEYIKRLKCGKKALTSAHARLARILSGPLYGNAISYENAHKELTFPHPAPVHDEAGVYFGV